MKELTKYRLFNRYRIIVTVAFISGLFVTWFFASGLYEATLGFNANAEDIQGSAKEVQTFLIYQLLDLDTYVSSTFNYISCIVPILVTVLTILFIKEKNSLFINLYVRHNKRRTVLIQTMLSHSVLNGLTIYLGFIIFLLVGLVINKVPVSFNRDGLDWLFGENFSIRHCFLGCVNKPVSRVINSSFLARIQIWNS